MARPIELGLTLEGEDARRFHEYMESPTFTKEGMDLVRQARELYESEEARIKKGLELLEREERPAWDPPV
jgi:hypothetical protein